MLKLVNCYKDARRAEAYARLTFSGTYYLAYRDIPLILLKHAKGKKAFDFGCGTGRSTRFLRKLGFDTVGVDEAKNMVIKAREIDPAGYYLTIEDGNLSVFESNAYDLVMCAFTFDNIPTLERKVAFFRNLRNLLRNRGILINLVSSPEIYTNEWASFSTRDFPENRYAKSGDKVRIIITDIDDKRPVEDFLCSDEDYQEIYKQAGLQLVQKYKPLATEQDPGKWVNETKIAPWTIYVLKPR